jgi:hypothetical protein
MAMAAINARYGNINGVCQVCYKEKDLFGTLVDNNGHKWLICSDDIGLIWGNQAYRDKPPEGEPNLLNDALMEGIIAEMQRRGYLTND